jgi:hypothetical protein
MSTLTPWHQVVQLRADVISGDLALKMFAADLYKVAIRDPDHELYVDPARFFARTHATHNMRRLVHAVSQRLSGRTDKAIRKLALTYGGGKTHSLISLLHLFGDPDGLPALPAVEEFRQAAGGPLPRAQIATVAFDKLDPEKGMDVLSPDGHERRLLHPWSVIAYQLAGDDGLRILHPDELAEERESPPTEQWLEKVLRVPQSKGRATLILMDEVLVWARGKVGLDRGWEKRIVDFFQFLTQAVASAEQCALVVSLLANDLRIRDALGKLIEVQIDEIFGRQKEEDIQPVEKRDIAHVLRQQFFTPESVNSTAPFRPHVQRIVANIAALDPATSRDPGGAEERYLQSYPFHPDLTDVFYTKWTGIEQFQQTRGVLRTFATALRDAAQWDTAPIVGPNVFLAAPGTEGITDAARELTEPARAAAVALGETVQWDRILEGELAKAREVQDGLGTLAHREIEQAVVATFLHSQPVPAEAHLHELLPLIGHSGPIKIELEKGLKRWANTSWYLDDDNLEVWRKSESVLPDEWRLGSRANLRQMHDYARTRRVKDEDVEAVLLDTIRAVNLTKGVQALGVHGHTLPTHTRDIADEAALHFAVLAPESASEAGSPSQYARRFVNQHTSEDKPRVYRNAVVCAVPSESALAAARNQIRDMLGWREVRAMKDFQGAPPHRVQQLADRLSAAEGEVPGSVRQAYCIVVTVSETNEVQAFRVTISKEPLFTTIKNDARSRITETAIEPTSLLPDGPHEIWPEDRPAQSAKDLVEAFFRYPRLPKLLTPKVVRDTLVRGCVDGSFALRYTRSDGSTRTYWFEVPSDAAIGDSSLEAVIPQHVTLTEISPALLEPGKLPGLWTGASISLADLYSYFAGGHMVTVDRATPQGVEIPQTYAIPKAEPEVVQAAAVAGVEQGRLWLVGGDVSLWKEPVPPGTLTAGSAFKAPPQPIAPVDLLPEALPAAWTDGSTTGREVYDALVEQHKEKLPWPLIELAISSAVQARILEPISGVRWPLEFSEANRTEFRLPGPKEPREQVHEQRPNVRVARAELGVDELQDLADIAGEIQSAAAGHGIRFRIEVEVGTGEPVPSQVFESVSELLQGVSEHLVLKGLG